MAQRRSLFVICSASLSRLILAKAELKYEQGGKQAVKSNTARLVLGILDARRNIAGCSRSGGMEVGMREHPDCQINMVLIYSKILGAVKHHLIVIVMRPEKKPLIRYSAQEWTVVLVWLGLSSLVLLS